MPAGLYHTKLIRWQEEQVFEKPDILAVEEPLEIRLQAGEMTRPVAVTMRTPGHDEELACGFLFTEGILQKREQLISAEKLLADENIISLKLQDGFVPDLKNTERNFYSTSSCGVCGKASINSIKTVSAFSNIKEQGRKILPGFFISLQEKLRKQQDFFEQTGGLHASAIFSPEGNLILLREDVGRHNALDKLVGHSFLHQMLPLSEFVLLLSGRASFELVQKAAMAGVKIIAAVGAPSSLALQTAKEMNITLLGFLKEKSFNVYCGEERISGLLEK